jgi:cyanophycinase
MVVGGGALGPEIYARFIELAGGPDAPIVVIPTAGGDSVYRPNWPGIRGLAAAGARNVTILHTLDRKEADTEKFIEPLRRAGGVWFPGGRQWHLVDSYAGTSTERELHAVLERSGVIGGSSAGASILASYLVRGAREGNTVMMAPGYEQGFGFLRNAAIDQHVVARDRLNDLPQVLARHPGLLGISEDEGTAWVIEGDQAEIIGRNKAFVYGGRDATDAGQPWLTLRPGDRYDLAERRVTHRAIADATITEAFVDSVFADYARLGAPGAAVLVAVDGRVLVNKGYGLADVGARTPVTTRTNFRLASVTKQFTAAATLLLVKDGKLRLNETLADIFPGFPAYGRRITVRHLLSHTSGLIDYEDFVPDSQTVQVHDADALARMMAVDSTYFAPGTQFKYSNTGFALLAEIVAKRSGKSFATFLRERIFVPLGMHKTVAFEEGVSTVAFRALGHSMQDGAWVRTDQSNTSAVLGDGGIYTSVDELYRWDQALYTGELLPQAMLAEAMADHPLADGSKSGYGYGWYTDTYRGLPRVWHTGSTRGFRNMIMRFPGQRAVIIALTNRNDQVPDTLVQRIADRLLFAPGDPRWVPQRVNSTSSCRSLSAVSATVAWAGCSRGTVFHTTDGGTAWRADTVAGAANLDFRGIAAFDANTAVIASAGPAEEGQARIYRTADGGAHWNLQWSDATKGVFLDGLAFWDSQHGIAYSDPVDGRLVILTTDDGGVTWVKVPAANIPPVLPKEAAFATSNTGIAVEGSLNAWIVTGGGAESRVFRTSDRGRSWSVTSTGMAGGASSGLFAVAFADAKNGVAVGGDFAIARGVTDFALRTSDGGVTWRRAGAVRPDGATQGLIVTRGASSPVFVSSGAYGTAISRDFGATWTHGDTLTVWGISFPRSGGAGWAVGPRGRITKFTGNIQ